MKNFVMIGCLLFCMQAVAQHNSWSKVNLNEKLTVLFPGEPMIEKTESGPQAQIKYGKDGKFTAVVLDLERAGVDVDNIEKFNDRQFRAFASTIAMKGNVRVNKIVNGKWNKRYPSALISGVNKDGRAVVLQFILLGKEVVALSYSAYAEVAEINDMNKFFTSIEYNPSAALTSAH